MRQIKKVAIIGAGSWGSAVAKNIAESKPYLTVIIWAYEKSVASSINSVNENSEFLPGIKLPANVTATNSLKEAVQDSDVVILATPSKVAYETSLRMAPFISADMHIGFLTKGFCKIQNAVLTISQAMEKAIPLLEGKAVAVSGPSHAEEVSQRFHTCLNVGSKSSESRAVIAELLTSEYVQCRETDDIRAVEVGGTLKNPAAIAAGMISVLPRCGDNMAGALISEALKEMVLLGKAFGISEEKMIDISGLGDLVATALSPHSRNRRFGRDLAGQIMKKGGTLNIWDRIVLRIRPASVIERMSGKFHYLAEGAYAIEPLIDMALSSGIHIPVYSALYEVLLNKKDPSLLIETIKNPAKFDELISSTKILTSDRKRGLEKMKGSVFRETILARTQDRLVGKQEKKMLPYGPEEVIGSLREDYSKGNCEARESGIISSISDKNYPESVRRLIELYLDGIIDNYNPLFKWAFMLFIALTRFVNIVTRKRSRIIISGRLDEVRNIEKSATVFYVAPFHSVYDSLFVIMSIFRKRLRFPRFFISSGIVTEWDRFILKRIGGFTVHRERLGNIVYREALGQYLSTIAGYGVPLLYSPSFAPEGHPEAARNEFISAITDCIYTHTVEMALVPVEVSYLRRPAESAGGPIPYGSVLANVTQVNFSKPVYLSDYTKQPNMIAGLPRVITGVWEKEKKVFPHYVLCKILADNNFMVTTNAAVKLVKAYTKRGGRNFDYSPGKIVRKGVRFLAGSGIVVLKDDVITAEDMEQVKYYANMLT
jgi:glycerol-3-phosphate dehydrogenase